MSSTHAAYMRGADRLQRLRPGSARPASAGTGRPMGPNVEAVARRYGSTPVPALYDCEHAELNRPPETVQAADSAVSGDVSDAGAPHRIPAHDAGARAAVAIPGVGAQRVAIAAAGSRVVAGARKRRRWIKFRAHAAHGEQAGVRASAQAGAARPPLPTTGSFDSIHNHGSHGGPASAASFAVPRCSGNSPLSHDIGSVTAGSPPRMSSRPSTRMAAVWAPEDAKHEFTIEELQQYVVAARLELDDENPNMPPLEDDPIAHAIRGGELERPTSQAVAHSWRCVVGNGRLELLRRRLAALCGVSRAHSVVFMNELEAIAVAEANGTLNRARLEYATRHSAHEAVLAALREAVGADTWTAEMERGWDELLKLLSK
eukprot:CAMPEP_0174872802 /NCGR_PEP_ID=MMETSP1114-20130205/73871_1 /TAXON_ID=312471 /ORGANISM="Neobodo designis, Strain CCAP 1951/1" /LENGTH=372 /DNA_ID=CAMNT_0016108113 /DNA_START=44 /DNA_END=1162 /DNA_ORIENTATION=+